MLTSIAGSHHFYSKINLLHSRDTLNNKKTTITTAHTQAYSRREAFQLTENFCTEISSLVHQADKMLPGEMRGSSQQNNMVIGGLGARGSQGVSEGIASFGGIEGGQQLGAQSQVSPMEQPPVASERAGYGGALEQGAVNQEGLGQGGLAGLSDSAVSRMSEDGTAGGSLQGIQGAQDVQGMQSLTSAFAGGQQVQGGMLSDGGGVSSLQGQGLMGGGLQGGLQGMMGGGLAGLPAMGGGGQFAQQQMSFKKVCGKKPKKKIKHRNDVIYN